MARKQPAAMQALNALKPRCAKCEADAIVRIGNENLCEAHYVADATEKANAMLEAKGLQRRPDESPSDYRERMSAWMREKVRHAFKRVTA